MKMHALSTRAVKRTDEVAFVNDLVSSAKGAESLLRQLGDVVR